LDSYNRHHIYINLYTDPENCSFMLFIFGSSAFHTRLRYPWQGCLHVAKPRFLYQIPDNQDSELFLALSNNAEAMSTTRLTFLYPHLFRSIRVGESATNTVRLRARRPQQQCLKTRGFATIGRKEQRFVQRHGKAVEPFLQHGETADSLKVFTPEEDGKDAEKGRDLVNKSQNTKAEEEENEDLEQEPSSSAPLSEETQAAAKLPGDGGTPVEEKPKVDGPTPLQTAAQNTKDVMAPLETILQMPLPETAEERNAAKPPHLQTPPYVHHFDTYTLVQQVEAGGFTEEQSITAMKAVRGLLALNLDVAKEGLVSKSDVENVRNHTYELQGQ
jgi:Protein of unknown function (DUF1640)